MSDEPNRTRLKLPTAYGAPLDSPLLDWSTVAARLQKAERFWLATADHNAVPISRPLDGIWFDNAFYFGGDPATRWRRNLAKNSRACLSVDDATDPVIVEGLVFIAPLDEELASTVAEVTQAKYGFGSVEQFKNETCVFRPLRCIAWIGLFQNATRFQFGD